MSRNFTPSQRHRFMVQRVPVLRGSPSRLDRLSWALVHAARRFDLLLSDRRSFRPPVRRVLLRNQRTLWRGLRRSARWHQVRHTHHKITGLHAAINRAK